MLQVRRDCNSGGEMKDVLLSIEAPGRRWLRRLLGETQACPDAQIVFAPQKPIGLP